MPRCVKALSSHPSCLAGFSYWSTTRSNRYAQAVRTLKDTHLVQRLSRESSGESLVGALLHLESGVAELLTYVPATFPHYTRHTLRHSVEIIDQIGLLLHSESNRPVPHTELNAVEMHILCCAALLHDAGMVVSDDEKLRLLDSPDWADWKDRWGAEVTDWFPVITPNDSNHIQRQFVLDVALRRMLAEFIRGRHHERSLEVVMRAPLPDFSLGEARMKRAIGSICVAHGLSHEEIDDPARYPTRTDILGQAVDLRFLAILLRIGDLLDLTHDRACPLTAWAAGTLPIGSGAHWSQYSALTHTVTSPERIEVHAECANQSEHRILTDWCGWICEEVEKAPALLSHSLRHGGWRPPLATMAASAPTIQIKPARDANYVPSDWKMQLDVQTVFHRLLSDAYSEPTAFLRELLQNAVDATRCRMYSEAHSEEKELPRWPHEFARAVRQKYPISIRVEEVVERTSDGTSRRNQYLVVEDCGIGMTADTVESYFLQAGRSFYTTRRFRDRYPFAPSSRFGIGFLSVFAVSDYVEVETQHIEADSQSLRFILTGPREYVLRETFPRRTPGTRIRLLLRVANKPGEITSYVTDLCRFVEFPITVDDLGASTTIFDAEREQLGPVYREVALSHDRPTLVGIPVSTEEASGFLLMNMYLDAEGIERIGEPPGWFWKLNRNERHNNVKSPIARRDREKSRWQEADQYRIPKRLACLGGLANKSLTENLGYEIAWSARVDLRPIPANIALTLDRTVKDARREIVKRLDSSVSEFTFEYRRRNPSIFVKANDLAYRRELYHRFTAYSASKELPILTARRRRSSGVWSLADLAARRISLVVHHRVTGALLDRLVDERYASLGTPEYPGESYTRASLARWVLLFSCDREDRQHTAPGVTEVRYPPRAIDIEDVHFSLSDLREGLDYRGYAPRLFMGRPLEIVRRLSPDWWLIEYGAQSESQSSKSISELPHKRRWLLAPMDGADLVGLCLPDPVSYELFPDALNRSGCLVLNVNNDLARWLYGYLEKYLDEFGLVDRELPSDAYVLEGALSSALRGSRRAAIELTNALDELVSILPNATDDLPRERRLRILRKQGLVST